jgi:sugar lactone lactonase YvrE
MSKPGEAARTSVRRTVVLAIGAACAIAALSTTGALAVSGGDTIKTVAGMGIYDDNGPDSQPGYGGDGGPATRARLGTVWGLALDAQGNLFFADRDNYRVRKVDRNGIITTVAGNGQVGFSGDGGPAIAARLERPSGVAVDAQGNLYINDEGNLRIRKVTPSGTITTFAGTGGFFPHFSGDGGPATLARIHMQEGQLAVDARGNVYLADSGNLVIRKIDTRGIISTVAGTPGVRGFGGDGGQATSAQFNSPRSLAFDRRGNMYVVDGGNARVRKIDTRGIITTIAGTGRGFDNFRDGIPATRARLYSPYGVAVDLAGNVYIADFSSGTVRKINTRGIITTVAGRHGTTAFCCDGGPARRAKLAGPHAVAIGPQGALYISDGHNYRVRMIVNAAPKWPRETCTIDYCVPRDWNAHPGKDLPAVVQNDKLLNRDEPLNVIFSAASDVKIDGILSALADSGGVPWRTVGRGTFPPACMSVESADVNGAGRIPQEHSWRVGGCIEGNLLSRSGDENHARLWAQRVPSSGKQAWFATVSLETACLVLKDELHIAYGDWRGHLGRPWHCVNGGPGSIRGKKNGYDMGARDLVNHVCAAAERRGWYASFRKDPRRAGVGQNGVRYSGSVYVLRVDTKPPQPAPSGVTRCGA